MAIANRFGRSCSGNLTMGRYCGQGPQDRGALGWKNGPYGERSRPKAGIDPGASIFLFKKIDGRADHFLKGLDVDVRELVLVDAAFAHLELPQSLQEIVLIPGAGKDIEGNGGFPGGKTHQGPIPFLAAPI